MFPQLMRPQTTAYTTTQTGGIDMNSIMELMMMMMVMGMMMNMMKGVMTQVT